MKHKSRRRQRGLLDRIALQKMKKLGLKKTKRLIFDYVTFANNHCGAMYGKAAY